jgi:non-homologous end joining protein Ku
LREKTSQLSGATPENYEDDYRIRVLAMLDEKSKGKEIVIDTAPAPKHGQVIDIMEALKRSMENIFDQPTPSPRPTVITGDDHCYAALLSS